MESCRNVLLEFVVEEARQQLDLLGRSLRHTYYLSEVVAYAINRMPPMFASTEADLKRFRQDCIANKSKIALMVQQALIGVRRDHERNPDPIPEVELHSAPYSLLKLRDILEQQQLLWRDVPHALLNYLEETLSDAHQQSTLYTSAGSGHRHVHLRSNPKNSSSASKGEGNPSGLSKIITPDHYTLESSLGIVHALERLVIRMAQTKAVRMYDQEELKWLRLDDVVATSLNRLPPMYATTGQGVNYWRQYARFNIGSEVSIIVQEALLESHQLAEYRRQHPLIFYRVRREREQALVQVSQLFFSRQVRWQNIVPLTQESLKRAQGGRVCWQRHLPNS
ncbi:MAG: late competence development ComFB family protein [Pseudanabaena sp. ELA607]